MGAGYTVFDLFSGRRNISTEMEVDPCNEEDTAQRMYDLLFDRDGSSTTRKEA